VLMNHALKEKKEELQKTERNDGAFMRKSEAIVLWECE